MKHNWIYVKWALRPGIVLVVLLLSTICAEGGVFDTIEDFVFPAERNKRDKERVLSVLAAQGAIVRKPDGTIRVIDQRHLDKIYDSLQSNGTLEKTYGFRKDDKDSDRKSGQFWKNFFDGKDYTRGDTPATMDPFENDSYGLATKMHSQLTTATDDASSSYNTVAGDLKLRGVDVMGDEMRRGVAAGADVYIKAMDALTGGTSTKTVEWAEEAAKWVKETGEDPQKAASDYIKGKIREEIENKMSEGLKKTLGEDQYENLMEKYEGYGTEQEKLKKLMSDMYKTTGDDRFKNAERKLDEYSAEELTKKVTENLLMPNALKTDEESKADGVAEEEKKTEEPQEAEKEAQEEKKVEAARDSGVVEKEDEGKKAEETEKIAEEETKAEEVEEARVVENETEEQDAGKIITTKGYVENSKGRTTVTETRAPDGSLVRTTETRTDSRGHSISQTTYEGGTGGGQTISPGNDLRNAEPEANGDSEDSDDDGDEEQKAGLKGFTTKRGERTEANAESSFGFMGEQQNVEQSSTRGDQAEADAKHAVDAAGTEAQSTKSKSASSTAAAEKEDSFGKAIADGVQKGVETGASALGTSFGEAAAKQVADAAFGDPDKDKHDGDGKGGASATGGKAVTQANTKKSSGSASSKKSGGTSSAKKGDAPSKTAATTDQPAEEAPAPKTRRGVFCKKCGSEMTYKGVYYADGTDMYYCPGCDGTMHTANGNCPYEVREVPIDPPASSPSATPAPTATSTPITTSTSSSKSPEKGKSGGWIIHCKTPGCPHTMELLMGNPSEPWECESCFMKRYMQEKGH